MKTGHIKISFFLALLAAGTSLTTTPALAATDTNFGLSINVGQPGFYGRIDINDYPQPQLVYAKPIMVERVTVNRPPIYLYVPPGHAKNWRKHCARYHACGERVFFVQDAWYTHEYVPRYQARHRDYHDSRYEYRNDRHIDHRNRHNDWYEESSR